MPWLFRRRWCRSPHVKTTLLFLPFFTRKKCRIVPPNEEVEQSVRPLDCSCCAEVQIRGCGWASARAYDKHQVESFEVGSIRSHTKSTNFGGKNACLHDCSEQKRA